MRVIRVKDTTLGNVTYAFPRELAVGQTETVILTKLQFPNDPLCSIVRATYGWFRLGTVTAVLGTAEACVD